MENKPSIKDWNQIDGKQFTSILLGNGFSANIWPQFRYESLFENADLTEDSKAIFDGLSTKDFEKVLESLTYAKTVVDCLKVDSERISRAYKNTQDGLFSAVNRVHIPWRDFRSDVHSAIISHLNSLNRVFTTSYDLCLYWSHMWCVDQKEVGRYDLVDFFWGPGGRFNPADTDVRDRSSTCFYYLHGGLHLAVDAATGCTYKRLARKAALLKADASDMNDQRTPLFVSEGLCRQKKAAIDKNEYLTFCLDSLVKNSEPLVIFGHGLQGQDSHIVDAIKESDVKEIAVSVYDGKHAPDPSDYMDQICGLFPRKKIEFFGSTTHPLGASSLSLG